MNKKDKKIFIIVTIVLGLILLVISQGKFRDLSVATDSVPTTTKTTKSFSVASEECGGNYYPDDGRGYGICCEIPGWTLDPSTEECNPPNQGDCSNDPSKKYDCSDYCSNGYIYAYNFDKCCDPQHPFTPDGQFCHTTPQPNSDNYYTRHSECTSTSQTKCQGENLYQCTESPQFIYKYSNQGQVTGQCGIQCVSLLDCSGNLPNCQSTQNCDFSCGGNTCIPVSPSTYYRLENNQCNPISLKPSEITANDYSILTSCQNAIIPSCGNGILESGEECDDGNGISNDGCSSTCKTEKSKFNFELIIGVLVILGIIGFVIYRFKGKRRSK